MSRPTLFHASRRLALWAAWVALFAIAGAGCQNAPKDAGDPLSAAIEDPDFSDMLALPERGDFNPDEDVDYSIFRSGALRGAGTIYFATDSATIPPQERGKLDQVAAWMNENSERSLLIAGHCDERGTLEYNRVLGERRALSVRDYLIGLRVGPKRLHTHSYGEERPAVQGSGPTVWEKNRRAEIGVVTK